MRKAILWLPLAAVVLLILSCPSSTQSDNGGGSSGSLVINLPLTNIQDPKNPDPEALSSFDVLGAGPGNASFQKLGITATSVTIDSLVPGDWGVTVAGNNYLNAAIASISMPVTIVEGTTAAAGVARSQLVSSGTLDLSLNWTASYDSIAVSLTPLGGVPYTVTVPAIATDAGISSVNASVPVPVGYYTLSRVYRDSSSQVTWGAADALQIKAGNTTKLALSAGVVTITPDISKVIQITFDNKDTYGNGQDISIKASPSGKVTSYQWYLNGQIQQTVTTPTISFTGNTLTGRYRLDVVVSAQGALSSDGITFTVK